MKASPDKYLCDQIHSQVWTHHSRADAEAHAQEERHILLGLEEIQDSAGIRLQQLPPGQHWTHSLLPELWIPSSFQL